MITHMSMEKTKKRVHYWNLCDSCYSQLISMILNQDIEENEAAHEKRRETR